MTYAATTALWVVFLASSIAALGLAARRARRDVVVGCVAVLAAAVLLQLTRPGPLYGLEYEDAFEYAYSALFMARHHDVRDAPLDPICVDGTLSRCAQYSWLPHPTGLAVAASWLVRMLGESSEYVHALSACFWSCGAAAVFLLSVHLGATTLPAIAGAMIYLVTPIWFALGASSLAEPSATGIAIATVLASYALVGTTASGAPPRRPRIYALWLSIASGVALAACVKREGLVLVGAIPAMHGLRLSCEQPAEHRWRRLQPIISATALGGVAAVGASAGGVVDLHAARPGSLPALSVHNFSVLAPHFVAHFSDWRAYGVLAALVLLGVTAGPHRGHAAGLAIFPLLYGAVFVSFGHTYYFEEHGEIPTFHFLRHSMQVAPYFAALAAFGVDRALRWVPDRSHGRACYAFVVAGIAAVLLGTRELGVQFARELADEERSLRLEPVAHLCDATPPDSFIVTAEPILPLLLCGPERHVVALDVLGDQVDGSAIAALLRKSRGFFHHARAGDADVARYASSLAVLKEFGVSVDGFRRPHLFELKSPPMSANDTPSRSP